MTREEAIKIVRNIYQTDAEKEALVTLIPELAESDVEKRMRAIAVLEQQRHFWSYEGPVDKTPPATKRKDLVEAIDVALAYLEKQKEQKPAEWSEEDEMMLHRAITIIERNSICNQNMIDWLKSLRPQPHWKPSDEQMKALQTVLPVIKGTGTNVQKILETLYNDLKTML